MIEIPHPDPDSGPVSLGCGAVLGPLEFAMESTSDEIHTAERAQDQGRAEKAEGGSNSK